MLSTSRLFALSVFVFFISMCSWSTVYTSISDGSYNNCGIWDNGCPSNSIQFGDTVVINHAVASTSSLDVKGVLLINSIGSYSNSNSIDINELGTVFNDGVLTCNSELEVNGYFYQSGTSSIYTLHNDGYICNSGSTDVIDRVFNHGGIIECNGNMNVCEVDMEDNNAASTITGSAASSISGQNLCCSSGGSSNPFDDLSGDWSIDSISVDICLEPLIPNAGDDASLELCNSAGSSIDLGTLLTNNTSGFFTELTSSGSFNSSSGVFNADGLDGGDYNFMYVVYGYNATSDTSYFTISVVDVLTSTEEITICENAFPFDWNGLSITEEGSVSVTLNSVVTGCDSTVTLNVQIHPTLSATENIVVCSNAFPFEWNGITISDGFETPSVNFVSEVTGCDSIVTLNISVNPILSAFDTITICENELPFNWNGLSLTESGTESVLLSSLITGCDSTITLNLFINAIPTSTTDTLVCGSQFPISWNGSVINGEGTQSVTLVSASGCDSIATINISVDQLSAPIINSDGPVSCPEDVVRFSVDEEPNAIYYWSGPEGFSSSDLSHEFALSENLMGTYSVYYTLNACSSEETSIGLEIENIFEFKDFKFPNVITPNNDLVNDEIVIENYVGYCADFILTIRDRWGSEVYRQERGDSSFVGDSVDGRGLPEGVYFYRLSFDEGDVSGFMHIVR